MSKKKLLIFVAVISIIVGLFFYLRRDSSPQEAVESKETNQPQAKTNPDHIRLIGVGDMLPHETVNQAAKSGDDYNYRQFFDQVEKYFQASDIRFCNQESPSAANLSITTYPTFNAPTAFSKDLSAVGCNVISLANNHANDRGQTGIDSTREIWDSLNPLGVAGSNRSESEQNKIAFFEIKGVKFAFVAYSEISNNNSLTPYGLNMFNENLVKTQLQEAKSSADIVIVSAHWGAEYSPDINANQKKWAKTFADNGADVVLGTGPHVLEPVQKLPKSGGGDTIVFYSLGNFLSTQLDTESLIGGLAIIDIDPANKQVKNVGFLPTYMHYEWTAEQKSREDLLSRKNLKIYPLDKSAEPLSKSQNNTSVEAQTARVTKLLNQYTAVNVIKSEDF